MTRPIIVGENNPYGGDQEFALYPRPVGCSGWRLCHVVMGLPEDQYLERFERINLLQRMRWSVAEAREAAAALYLKYPNGSFILLGTKVREAFQFGKPTPSTFSRAESGGRTYYILPHPSGRCTIWNDQKAVLRARSLLWEFLR